MSKLTEIECEVCGEIFMPVNRKQKMCPACREVIYFNRGRNLPRTYTNPVNIAPYEAGLRERNVERFHDTIVAIGYAERQMAKTLESVGKIKTEL